MHFNIRLRKRGDTTSRSTLGTEPTSARAFEQTRGTIDRSVRNQKPAAAAAASSRSARRPTMTTRQESFPRSSTGSRPRSTKMHHRVRSRIRSRTRSRGRRNNLSPNGYPAYPFTCRLQPVRHKQRPPLPKGIKARCKFLLSALRRKLHVLKFDFLIHVDVFRRWVSAKLGLPKAVRWFNNNILLKKPELRRPFFPRGRTSCEEAQYQRVAGTATSRSGSNGSHGEEMKVRIRRLSHSTVRSLKKACNLSTERDDLREEDRRAMERLEELWRTRDDY
jgi:hypothetical protein